MDKLKMHSPNMTKNNVARIRELFPNCVTEAKDKEGVVQLTVDFDQLKQELSESIVEGSQERYHLNWPGKREALLTANAPIAKTLRPCYEESVDFDTTKNLFIEGDNLDALKLLQDTYLGKVKMIYIDPPYNTGNDFVYEDDFAEDSESYKLRSNQKDQAGNRLHANTEANGRFHSDWLSMMYARLRLARNLLAEDGAIFISIGAEEVCNLKSVMDEVYGSTNYIEIFSWVKTSTPPALSTKSRKTNEYILCYEKSKNSYKYNGEPLDGGDQPLLNTGNSVRELKFPKSKVKFTFIENGILKAGITERVELKSQIEIHNGFATSDFTLAGEFKWTQDFLDAEIGKGTTFVVKSEKLSIRFIRDEEGFKRPTNFIRDKYTSPIIDKKNADVGTNESGSTELTKLMGRELFPYPKPTSLIEYLAGFMLGKEDLILDFFSGSATTAHAVMQLNAEDGGKRQFIMVQLPEACDPKSEAFKAGYKTIAEIGKERIRRAGQKIKADNTDKEHINQLDIGFRTLKIDTSNMADVFYAPDALDKNNLDLFVNNIKSDRTAQDLLFQVLLDWGVDLTLPITKQSIQGNDVFFVDGNALAACFDDSGSIDEDFVKKLATHQPLRVVFRDAGFKDSAVKINVEQIFKLRSPATEVKCI